METNPNSKETDTTQVPPAATVDRGYMPPQKPIGGQLDPLFKWLGKNKKLVGLLVVQYGLLYVLGRLDLVAGILLAVPVVVFSEAAY